ncbi:M24 family metallopeptidase [Streptomyces sp. NPDC058695]|uniref:M24 family metallopeptidase n=1 Tax=Streptomyces sp. NPDC058695 TaxID=3346604 RepID=UPI00365BA49B
MSDRIGALARQAPAWGACGSWRAVRSGPHSALPAGREPPEDRIITEDDIAIADLGPVLAGYESGFVRTVVIGQDPDKRRLIEDLPRLFAAAREAFHADRTLTGSHLHAEIQALASKAGWPLGGWNAGHMGGAACPRRRTVVRRVHLPRQRPPPPPYGRGRPAGPLVAGDQPARRPPPRGGPMILVTGGLGMTGARTARALTVQDEVPRYVEQYTPSTLHARPGPGRKRAGPVPRCRSSPTRPPCWSRRRFRRGVRGRPVLRPCRAHLRQRQPRPRA